MTNYQAREAQRLGVLTQLEQAENDELNRKAREVRAENIRRVALAGRS
jgi:hypothetical protein